jgi:hypothetical protein
MSEEISERDLKSNEKNITEEMIDSHFVKISEKKMLENLITS